MAEDRNIKGQFIPGVSGNPAGRKPGIPDRRRKMTEAILDDLEGILNVVKARAADGDMQAAALLLARTLPAMKSEGERVEFEFDPKASPAKQIESIMNAVASGDLTLEQGRQMVEMAGRLAEVRALEGGDDKAQKLVDVFREFAQGIEARTVAPYTPPATK